MSYWWDKSNGLGSFPWASSCCHTVTLLQRWSSVVTGCKTFKIKCKLNQKRMFEKHFIEKKKRNWTWYAFWMRLFSEGKIPGLLWRSTGMKYPLNEWSSQKVWSEKMWGWGFFCVCITIFLPRTDYWNDNVVIVDFKKTTLISILVDKFSQKTRLLTEWKSVKNNAFIWKLMPLLVISNTKKDTN